VDAQAIACHTVFSDPRNTVWHASFETEMARLEFLDSVSEIRKHRAERHLFGFMYLQVKC
jgi:hypothetical protein